MEMPKTGDVQFFEHQKTASHQISLQILIPRPTFTLKQVKPGFLLHGNAENRRCSIFGTSKNGVTPNLTLDSDSPFRIYPYSTLHIKLMYAGLFFTIFNLNYKKSCDDVIFGTPTWNK